MKSVLIQERVAPVSINARAGTLLIIISTSIRVDAVNTANTCSPTPNLRLVTSWNTPHSIKTL